MGKFLEKFKNSTEKTQKIIEKFEKKEEKKKSQEYDPWGTGDDIFSDSPTNSKQNNSLFGDEFPIINNNGQSQKPESFHRFILENQYQDLERSIRGIKDVWDARNQKMISVRKKIHCFTEEEAENILRTAQSHLSGDIKLSLLPKETFGDFMIRHFKMFKTLFRSIAEYNYGRYGSYENQYEMKMQNIKILNELWMRIQANYSRAIGGMENRATHDNIKGQESLNVSGAGPFSTRYF